MNSTNRKSHLFPNEIWPDNWFQPLSPDAVFPESDAPVEIDLGCGDGGFLHQLAQAVPDRNYIGIERLLGRVKKVCRGADRLRLKNVRGIRIETMYAIEHLIPSGYANRIHLLFPDPWPKAKHHKRRLMCQSAFFTHVHRMLEDGGEFLFKTDHEGYFEAAMEDAAWGSRFEQIDWPEKAFIYPTTDFERMWQEQGRSFYRIRLKRLS